MTEDQVRSVYHEYIVSAVEQASDGLSWAEFGTILVGFLKLAVRVADDMLGDGPAKKAVVMAAAAMLFDSLAGSLVPLAGWPLWWFVRPVIRAAVLQISSGTIEVLLPVVRSEP